MLSASLSARPPPPTLHHHSHRCPTPSAQFVCFRASAASSEPQIAPGSALGPNSSPPPSTSTLTPRSPSLRVTLTPQPRSAELASRDTKPWLSSRQKRPPPRPRPRPTQVRARTATATRRTTMTAETWTFQTSLKAFSPVPSRERLSRPGVRVTGTRGDFTIPRVAGGS